MVRWSSAQSLGIVGPSFRERKPHRGPVTQALADRLFGFWVTLMSNQPSRVSPPQTRKGKRCPESMSVSRCGRIPVLKPVRFLCAKRESEQWVRRGTDLVIIPMIGGQHFTSVPAVGANTIKNYKRP